MKSIKQKTTLFSDTVDERTAAVVRRIQGKHERFATDFLGNDSVAVRLEAWRDEETGYWAIDRLIYVASISSVKQEIEARPGLCFFDALSHCARFQATELALQDGRQIIDLPGERWTSIPSYREAAEAAHQIIDGDGYARPCADGRILTEGLYSLDAMNTAHMTKAKDLAPVIPSRSFPGMVSSLLTVNATAISNNDIIGRVAKKRAILASRAENLNPFIEASRAGQELNACVYNLSRREFKALGIGPAYLFTLGILPAFDFLKGDIDRAPKRHFFLVKNKFQKAVTAMPDGQEKTLTAEFTRTAETAFWLERAVSLIKIHGESQQNADKKIKTALDFIQHAGTLARMSDIDVNRLKSEYIDQGFTPGTFAGQLYRAWSFCDVNIHRYINAVEDNADIAGGDEIGQVLPDGTLYGGISPTTGRMMFVAPRDEEKKLIDDWNRIVSRISDLKNFHGYDSNTDHTEERLEISLKEGKRDRGWRLPTKEELKILYKNKDEGGFKGSFTDNAAKSESKYWSCSPYYHSSERKCIYDFSNDTYKDAYAHTSPSYSYRLVRSI